VRNDKPDVDHVGVPGGSTLGSASRRAQWRTARYAIGALFAFGALYACAVNVQWAELFDALRGASLPWTAAATASVLVTLALVTIRWGLLVGDGPPLAPLGPTEVGPYDRLSRRWRVLWDSVVLGQAVNILVPLRFGEGARLAVTCRGLNAPVGRVMVGLVLERAFDVAAFATMALMLIVSGTMPAAFGGLLPPAATVTLATISIALLSVRFVPSVLAWLRPRLGVLAPAAAWIEKQEVAMRGGWANITRRRQLAITAFLTALIPVTAAATNLLVFRAFSLPVPVMTALVLLVVLQIGTAVVSVPGNIGVFHYLTVVTLAAWGVPRPTAFATAIVLHAVSLGPKVILAAFTPTLWRGAFFDALPSDVNRS
jgi:uncharacterized membrane protein YbhN (UPF0104 family)